MLRLKSLVAGLAIAGSLFLAGSPARAADDIVDTAVKAGSFNTLVAAVKAAGLVETLKGKGPFTVFAPTDEAFAKLPKATLEVAVEAREQGQARVDSHLSRRCREVRCSSHHRRQVEAVRREVRSGRQHRGRSAQWREGLRRECREDGCGDVKRRDSRDRYCDSAAREEGLGATPSSLTTIGDLDCVLKRSRAAGLMASRRSCSEVEMRAFRMGVVFVGIFFTLVATVVVAWAYMANNVEQPKYRVVVADGGGGCDDQ